MTAIENEASKRKRAARCAVRVASVLRGDIGRLLATIETKGDGVLFRLDFLQLCNKLGVVPNNFEIVSKHYDLLL